MIFPQLDALEKKINSRYLLAILVSKRARQIKDESPRLPGIAQPHPITLALRELLEHDIKILIDDPTLGLNLAEGDIDVEQLRELARAEYAAIGGHPEPPLPSPLLAIQDADVEELVAEEFQIVSPVDVEVAAVEEEGLVSAPAVQGGIGGLDDFGEPIYVDNDDEDDGL